MNTKAARDRSSKQEVLDDAGLVGGRRNHNIYVIDDDDDEVDNQSSRLATEPLS